MKHTKILWSILPNNSNLLYHNTYNLALKNIAAKYGIECGCPGISTMDEHIHYTFPLPDYSDPIIFMCHHPYWNHNCEASIKQRCPNARIVMTGSDTVYYGVDGCTDMSNIVLYIDTIKEQVELLNKKLPAEHLYWTISQDIIDMSRNVVGTKQHKSCISLCTGTGYRHNLFATLNNNGYNVRYDINEFHFDNVLNIYASSQFVIGTTSPCAGFGEHQKRSMKGMRDWLGTFCGTVLVCDDYPDIVDIGTNIVPTYEYNNPAHCVDLLDFIANDPVVYNAILYNQQQWLLKHTMEIQLENILLKHNLL